MPVVPCVLRRISTGEILNYNINYPNADPNSPVIGMDEDLELLAKYTPYNIPDYDSRLYLLEILEGPGSGSTEYHPIYTLLKQWRIEYGTVKRSVDEQKTSVSNAEELANSKVFPITKQLKYLTLGVSILNRKIDGITLTPTEEVILSRIHDKALCIWRNNSNASSMYTQIDENQEPNIDDGWDETDPETT
jgi:hypothetical protein